MSFAVVYSRANVGVHAPLVAVETHLARGLPQFTVVGLAEKAVKESKDRVRGAIIESGFEFPKRRITVNLAPADLPKEGGRFDLPIAISILIASKQISCEDITHYEFAGELALSGELRACRGIMPFALACSKANNRLVIPEENINEARWVSPLSIYGMKTLERVCSHLANTQTQSPITTTTPELTTSQTNLCVSEIFGQFQAKRALEIAAAGDHSLLLVGPPGTGKTMLASRLGTLLPPLSHQEALEVAAIYSISKQGIKQYELGQRPFRQPHHTASAIALVGGGSTPAPGEVSLAHHGVLFLDELPEFSRHVLEVLREPLESKKIHISRAKGAAEYPAQFQLIAAMNPCPCGYLNSRQKTCQCTQEQIQRYRNKLSGPLIDRIDMIIEVGSIDAQQLMLFEGDHECTSTMTRDRVCIAREKQLTRNGCLNARIASKNIAARCQIDEAGQKMFAEALKKLNISARAFHRILKVARTIADLAGVDLITSDHLAEAIQFRKYEFGK